MKRMVLLVALVSLSSTIQAQDGTGHWGEAPTEQNQGVSEDCCSSCRCSRSREELTGDWWGLRSCLEDHGIEFEASVTQFYQGVASGGRERRFADSGHGEYGLLIDFDELCGCAGSSLELGAEHRFGETVNRDTGSVIPVALLPNLPTPETNSLALTEVVLFQELSAGTIQTSAKNLAPSCRACSAMDKAWNSITGSRSANSSTSLPIFRS